MLDQPGVAVRALQPKPALPAQGKRRVAAAIEEQQGLLLALERERDRLRQPRRDEAAARWALGPQVDRLDCRQMLAAEAFRERKLAVAPAPRIHLGFNRGGRGSQHDRDVGFARAHHRQVAGVVAHAVFLLVDGVVLLIDDDQAEIRIGQEQRRARADDHRGGAVRHRRPGTRPPPRRHRRMPFRRTHAEARRETVEERHGQCDFGQQDQGLAPAPDGGGDRFEIHVGLAGAGHPVDQRDRIAASVDGGPQGIRGRQLRGGEVGAWMIGMRRFRYRLRRQHQGLQRALVDQAIDHAGRDAGLAGGLALCPRQAVRQQREDARPRGR